MNEKIEKLLTELSISISEWTQDCDCIHYNEMIKFIERIDLVLENKNIATGG